MKWLLPLVLISLVCAIPVIDPGNAQINAKVFREVIGSELSDSIAQAKTPREQVASFVKSLSVFLDTMKLPAELEEQRRNYVSNDEYPYFKFIPQYIGTILPGKELNVEAPCFKSSKFTAKLKSDMSIKIDYDVNKAVEPTCSDYYLFATLENYALKNIYFSGQDSITMYFDEEDEETYKWDVNTQGVRVFRFVSGPVDTLDQVSKTMKMFEALADKKIDDDVYESNLDFMKKYVRMEYPKRNDTVIAIPEDQINSGDILVIYRPDGLDSMMAFGMGSASGHIVSLLRIDGELYVTEAQASSGYWPTNGIQRTPYRTWLKQAHEAEMNVLYLKLNEKMAKAFDEKQAVEWFKKVEGFNYGYNALLFGWLDSAAGNLPCLAPDFKSHCFSWEAVEIGMQMAYDFIPEMIDKIWGQAINHRVGLYNATIPQCYKHAYEQGTPLHKIIDVVEQDSWLYDTTFNDKPAKGPAMVCCVYSCNLWKHAGLFGEYTDTINCGEFTNLDDYKLNWFEQEPLPLCKARDPKNPHCQVMGKVQMPLPHFNEVPAHAHMADNCPSLPPNYIQSDDC